MSAFIIQTFADRVEMLTDGAVYMPDGTLVAIEEKVYRLRNAPAAITGRGSLAGFQGIGIALDTLVLATGSLDGAVAELAPRMSRFADSETAAFEIVIAGISESMGPGAAYFTTRGYTAGFEAFKLVPIDGIVGGSSDELFADMISAGLEPSMFENGFRERGADLMELMRQRKMGNPTDPDAPDVYGIGGHVDFTVVTASGVTTERLRTWPDVIGELIDPSRATAVKEAA